jgi:hypothetical protein
MTSFHFSTTEARQLQEQICFFSDERSDQVRIGVVRIARSEKSILELIVL